MTHIPSRNMPEPVESATKARELTTELVKKNDEIVKAAEKKKQVVETTCEVT